MIKRICICDRCGEQTTAPVAVTFNSLDLETGDIANHAEFTPERREYCPGCASYIHSGLALKQQAMGKPLEESEDDVDSTGREMAPEAIVPEKKL